MKYLGGKYRTAGDISSYINAIIKPKQSYWEPFVGAAWVLVKIRCGGRKYASDINPYLIEMWKAAVNGWIPPETITEDDYNKIKDNIDEYPPSLVSFVGFATSFGGKWFGGYARNANPSRNYAREGSRSILRKVKYLSGVRFFTADFLTEPPPEPKMLIYCDPPYAGTTDYGNTPSFDTGVFWNRVRELESLGHNVVVSEYKAPHDFKKVLEIGTKTDLHTTEGKDSRLERLFSLAPVNERIKQLELF